LIAIKFIAKDLKDKMDPIVALAKSKYPQMNTVDAIKKLKSDLDSLHFRTNKLEVRNSNIARNRVAFEKLKRSQPEFDCDLILELDNGEIYLTIQFKFHNKVPIVYRPSIENFEKKDIKPSLYTKLPECNPNNETGMIFKFKYSKLDELRYVKGYYNIITMKVPYQSKYYEQVNDKSLEGEVVKEYILDMTVPTLKQLRN
jgi:hypothetical protein